MAMAKQLYNILKKKCKFKRQMLLFTGNCHRRQSHLRFIEANKQKSAKPCKKTQPHYHHAPPTNPSTITPTIGAKHYHLRHSRLDKFIKNLWTT
jgi:hypothetical protein